jgi:hypothetical protein
LVIDTVVCLTLAKWETVSGRFGGYLIWPWPDRKYGWFLEPSYTYSFINGHEQSLGIGVGLLIAIR